MKDTIKEDFTNLLERYKALFFRSSDLVLKFNVDYTWRLTPNEEPTHEIYVTVLSSGDKVGFERYNIRRLYNQKAFFDESEERRITYQKDIIRSMMYELFDHLIEHAKIHDYRSVEQQLEFEKTRANRLKITCTSLENKIGKQDREIVSLRKKLCQKLSRKY